MAGIIKGNDDSKSKDGSLIGLIMNKYNSKPD